MIRSKDLNQELKILDDKVKNAPDTVNNADVVKAVTLIAKLVRDVRTNQVKGLEAAGVKLIVPDASKYKGGEKKDTENK